MSDVDFSGDIFPIRHEEKPLSKVDELFLSFGGTPSTVDNWQAIALTVISLLEERTRFAGASNDVRPR